MHTICYITLQHTDYILIFVKICYLSSLNFKYAFVVVFYSGKHFIIIYLIKFRTLVNSLITKCL
jgi:hypothetical protein